MKVESAFSTVVLPEPVPPLTIRLRRSRTAAREQVAQLLVEAATRDELVRVGTDAGEAADRHRRAVDRERRDDDVHARAVGKPAVGHRAELVDAPADRPEHALDDVAQRLLVGEPDRRPARARPRRSAQTSS